MREILRQRLAELDERMAQMRLYRKELGAALAEWEEAGDVEGHICGLIEGTKLEHPAPDARGINQRSGAKKKRR